MTDCKSVDNFPFFYDNYLRHIRHGTSIYFKRPLNSKKVIIKHLYHLIIFSQLGTQYPRLLKVMRMDFMKNKHKTLCHKWGDNAISS